MGGIVPARSERRAAAPKRDDSRARPSSFRHRAPLSPTPRSVDGTRFRSVPPGAAGGKRVALLPRGTQRSEGDRRGRDPMRAHFFLLPRGTRGLGSVANDALLDAAHFTIETPDLRGGGIRSLRAPRPRRVPGP